MAHTAERTFWLGHVSGAAVTTAAHAVLVAMLIAFHGSAGVAAEGMPSVVVPPPPSVRARLVKLGRPANTKRTRTNTIVATSPQTGIALSKTNRAETKERPTKAPISKNAIDSDALARTLAHAAQLGQQGSPEQGIGSPDGVEGGEIDAAEAREIDLYMTMLQRLFRANFRVPATVQNVSSMRCRVRVRINRDLSVGSPAVSASSGDATFDASAVSAARAVNTVPPPPPEIADQVLGRSITVQYRGSSN